MYLVLRTNTIKIEKFSRWDVLKHLNTNWVAMLLARTQFKLTNQNEDETRFRSSCNGPLSQCIAKAY